MYLEFVQQSCHGNSEKRCFTSKRAKKNNKSALIQIYDSYWLPLYTYTYSLLTNKEDTEEIVQNIFISLWKNRGKLKIETSLKSYLYTSCRYQAFHLIRKKSSEKMRYAELAKIFEKNR